MGPDCETGLFQVGQQQSSATVHSNQDPRKIDGKCSEHLLSKPPSNPVPLPANEEIKPSVIRTSAQKLQNISVVTANNSSTGDHGTLKSSAASLDSKTNENTSISQIDKTAGAAPVHSTSTGNNTQNVNPTTTEFNKHGEYYQFGSSSQNGSHNSGSSHYNPHNPLCTSVGAQSFASPSYNQGGYPYQLHQSNPYGQHWGFMNSHYQNQQVAATMHHNQFQYSQPSPYHPAAHTYWQGPTFQSNQSYLPAQYRHSSSQNLYENNPGTYYNSYYEHSDYRNQQFLQDSQQQYHHLTYRHPSVPQTPSIPQLPSVPQSPSVPQPPSVPQLASVPQPYPVLHSPGVSQFTVSRAPLIPQPQTAINSSLPASVQDRGVPRANN